MGLHLNLSEDLSDVFSGASKVDPDENKKADIGFRQPPPVLQLDL